MDKTQKKICALAYFLFFLPLMVDASNENYRFHANQGLDLLVFIGGIACIGSLVPVIGWYLILPLGAVCTLALLISGIINAVEGKKKELPVIGRFKFFKM